MKFFQLAQLAQFELRENSNVSFQWSWNAVTCSRKSPTFRPSIPIPRLVKCTDHITNVVCRNILILQILLKDFVISALFIICGVGVAGDRLLPNQALPHYSTTVFCVALIFAVIAGAVCVFDIVQGSGSAVQDTWKGGQAWSWKNKFINIFSTRNQIELNNKSAIVFVPAIQLNATDTFKIWFYHC